MKKGQEKKSALTKLPIIPQGATGQTGGEGVFGYPATSPTKAQPVFILHSGGNELVILGEVKAKVEAVEKKLDTIGATLNDLNERVAGLESLVAVLELIPGGVGDKIKTIRKARIKPQ